MGYVTQSVTPTPDFDFFDTHSFINSGQVVPCRVYQGAVGSSCIAYAAWFDCGGKVSEVSISRSNPLLEVTVTNLERRLQSQYMLVLRLIVGTIGELQLKYECERTARCRVIAFPLNC